MSQKGGINNRFSIFSEKREKKTEKQRYIIAKGRTIGKE
jgi:hypothetical protein